MRLERQSPRGFPPFVHFRRRFIDRAELYDTHYTLVAEKDGKVIGISSIALKSTFVNRIPVTMGYSFDTRVSPDYRRNGVGHALVQEKLRWAKSQGAVGAYSLVVATNQASLGMTAKAGYARTHMILYLQYSPAPLMMPLKGDVSVSPHPPDDQRIRAHYELRDLYAPHIMEHLHPYDYQRWHYKDEAGHCAGLSVYDQAKVYVHVPIEAPWPTNEQEIARLGRCWQLFDMVGAESPATLATLLAVLRDEAVMSNVNKLIWLVDRNDPLPSFVFDEASSQLDYWLLYNNFEPDAVPQWNGPVYLDPRDL